MTGVSGWFSAKACSGVGRVSGGTNPLERYGRNSTKNEKPLGPNSVAWMEAGLRALRASGLEPLERLAVITTLSGYVRQHAALLQNMHDRAGGRPRREVELERSDTLASLIDPKRFPEVSAVLATGAFDAQGPDPEGDPDFDFGLHCILEGVARLAQREQGGTDPRSADDNSTEG
jgi:hypothetical protein